MKSVDLAYSAVMAKLQGASWGKILEQAASRYFLDKGMSLAGDLFSASKMPIQNALAHGVVGGTYNLMNHEKFLPGFAAGVASGLFETQVPAHSKLAQLATSGVGGLTSKQSGGNFASGYAIGNAGYVHNKDDHDHPPLKDTLKSTGMKWLKTETESKQLFARAGGWFSGKLVTVAVSSSGVGALIAYPTGKAVNWFMTKLIIAVNTRPPNGFEVPTDGWMSYDDPLYSNRLFGPTDF